MSLEQMSLEQMSLEQMSLEQMSLEQMSLEKKSHPTDLLIYPTLFFIILFIPLISCWKKVV